MSDTATLSPKVRAAIRANHIQTFDTDKCLGCWMMKDATVPCAIVRMLGMVEDQERIIAQHSALIEAAREYAEAYTALETADDIRQPPALTIEYEDAIERYDAAHGALHAAAIAAAERATDSIDPHRVARALAELHSVALATLERATEKVDK